MVTGIVLITADPERTSRLAEELTELPGVSEVFSVAGRYDLVALVRVRENEDLAEAVGGRMRQLEGIAATETLIAFRAYSRKELEEGFALGVD